VAISKKPAFFRARALFAALQAQAGHRPNLGAWFGYQEVRYQRPLRPAQLSFAHLLQQRAPLSVVFDKTETGSSGVGLSVDPAREGMAFHRL
jgi:hypothetical protein